MAKMIKIETDYRFYAVELTDEQLERYKSGEDGEDEVFEELMEMDWEFIRDKDGGTDYQLEE
jgi:hypothetical protein